MIYLYVESENQSDGSELHFLCLSHQQLDDHPVILSRSRDDLAINAKGGQLANTLRLGGAQVEWSPL